MSELRHIKGLSPLQAQLNKVPAVIEAQVMRGGMRAGGKVFETELQARVPEVRRSDGSIGELRKSVKTTTTSKGGVVAAHVKMGGKKAWWGYLIEFTGAAPHDIKPKTRASLFLAGLFKEIVHHPGFIARAPMRTVMDSKAGAAVIAVGEYVRDRLGSLKLSQAYGTARTSEEITDVG